MKWVEIKIINDNNWRFKKKTNPSAIRYIYPALGKVTSYNIMINSLITSLQACTLKMLSLHNTWNWSRRSLPIYINIYIYDSWISFEILNAQFPTSTHLYLHRYMRIICSAEQHLYEKLCYIKITIYAGTKERISGMILRAIYTRCSHMNPSRYFYCTFVCVCVIRDPIYMYTLAIIINRKGPFSCELQ